MNRLAISVTTGTIQLLAPLAQYLPAEDFVPKSQTAEAAARMPDVPQPVDPRKVKVGCELGRRVGITIEGNLLKLNPDEHIKPFVIKNTRGAEPFIGTGDSREVLAAGVRNSNSEQKRTTWKQSNRKDCSAPRRPSTEEAGTCGPALEPTARTRSKETS